MTTAVYEVWQYAGRIYGNERTHLSPTQSVRGFSYTYEFRGKSAHFIIVTHDSNISRDAALEFATAIHAGRFERKRIDLSGCYFDRSDKKNKLYTKDSE